VIGHPGSGHWVRMDRLPATWLALVPGTQVLQVLTVAERLGACADAVLEGTGLTVAGLRTRKGRRFRILPDATGRRPRSKSG
jgi:hypothetical protein